jgi:hypothetical protein
MNWVTQCFEPTKAPQCNINNDVQCGWGALQMLVLDEADRILDMGFAATLDAILENLPREGRQTMLFSATQTKSVRVSRSQCCKSVNSAAAGGLWSQLLAIVLPCMYAVSMSTASSAVGLRCSTNASLQFPGQNQSAIHLIIRVIHSSTFCVKDTVICLHWRINTLLCTCRILVVVVYSVGFPPIITRFIPFLILHASLLHPAQDLAHLSPRFYPIPNQSN